VEVRSISFPSAARPQILHQSGKSYLAFLGEVLFTLSNAALRLVLVTSRPTEDLMAVYDPRQGSSGNFLWRVMRRDGLQSGETPPVTQFEKAFEGAQKHK
jgi:hypothetical protein